MLTLHVTNRLGLEVWLIKLAGREIHTFLCERIARTRFERLRTEFARSNGRREEA